MPKKNRTDLLQMLPTWLGWGGAAASGLALFVYAYLGTFSRFYADDFCMSGLVVQHGFWPAQWIQYTSWSNRFAGMFTLAASDLLGRSFVRVFPGLILLLWFLGLAWALARLARLLRYSIPRWLPYFLAGWTVLVALLLAPDLYQSLFWRVGAITYTLPLATMGFLVGTVIEAYRRAAVGGNAWGWRVAAGLLAFFAGGLSETYLALQCSILGASLAFVLLHNADAARRRPAVWAVGAALVGSLVSLAVVLLSPGNAVRQAAMPAHPGLLALVRMDLTSTFLFVYISLKNSAFQFLVAMLGPLFAVYGHFVGATNAARLRPSSLILALLVVPLAGCLAIAAVMLPASYAQSSYPDGRVLIVASFVLALMLVAVGSLLGTILSQLHRWAEETVPVTLRLLSAFLAVAVLLYPLYDAYKSYRLIPAFRADALAWDARDGHILQARLAGESQIVATSLEAPSGMSELRTDPSDWVNSCMAMFYEVDSIIATP
jgi:hypothetical protein